MIKLTDRHLEIYDKLMRDPGCLKAGCTDMPEELVKLLTREEWKVLFMAFDNWNTNGKPEYTEDEVDELNCIYLQTYAYEAMIREALTWSYRRAHLTLP